MRKRNGQFKSPNNFVSLALLVGLTMIGAVIQWLYTPVMLYSPLAKADEGVYESPSPSSMAEGEVDEPAPSPSSSPTSVDEMIDFNCRKYYSGKNSQEYCKFQMHCLYWKESRNGQSNDHGDGGKAGGPFQFWQETWNRMRGQMIREGHIRATGSRYNLDEAVETTVWALSKGRENEWGPVLRGECK